MQMESASGKTAVPQVRPQPMPAAATMPVARSHMGTSCLLAASVLLCALLLPQRRLHGDDTDHYVVLLQGGHPEGLVRHVGYLPFVSVLLSMLRPFGGGAFQALLLASALGAAVAAFCLHRAARLLAPADLRPAAVAVAAVVLPAAWYFATAAEAHGVFAGAAAAAWWAFARWRLAPGGRFALVLGVLTGAAWLLHSFGALLLPWFVSARWLLSERERRPRAGELAVAVIAFLAVAGLGSLGLGGSALGQVRGAWSFLQDWCEPVVPTAAIAMVWWEWLLPFGPWSLLALFGLLSRRSRPWALVTVVGLLLHAPFLVVLLARTDLRQELGAYLLPLALPAVLAGLAWLPRVCHWPAIAAGAALALGLVMPSWRPLADPAFVAGVQELRRERPFALLVDAAELEGVRMHVEGVVCAEALRTFGTVLGGAPMDGEALAGWFDGCVLALTTDGAPLLVTDAARAAIAAAPWPALRSLWETHIRSTYRCEVFACRGLRGTLLLPR